MKGKIYTLSENTDFKLIALVSHLNDYKISWLFNEQLNCKFSQADDLIITDEKNLTTSKFSVFTYEDNSDSVYTLYSNHYTNDTILKSIKKVDFILKYSGIMSDSQIEELIDKIKGLKNIITAFQIDMNTLKPKELELFI